MWAEVSSSAPHLLRSGLSDSPIRWRCLVRVLCPVSRPVTALDCVLLKVRNLALAPRQGPEISSRACLGVSPRPRHHTQRQLTNQLLILLRTSCLETPKTGSGPTNFRAEPSLASPSAISLSCTPACQGTQYPVNTFPKLIIVLKFRHFLGLPSCRCPLSFITEILFSSSTHLGILTFNSKKHNEISYSFTLKAELHSCYF